MNASPESSEGLTRREFMLHTGMSMATPLLSGSPLGASVVEKGAKEVIISEVINRPTYQSAHVRRFFALTYGPTFDAVTRIDDETRKRLYEIRSARELNDQYAHAVLAVLPANDDVRIAYERAIDTRTLEDEEYGRLRIEAQAMHLEDEIEVRRCTVDWFEENQVIQDDLGYANTVEVLHRSGLDRVGLFRQWIDLPRRRTPVPPDFIQETLLGMQKALMTDANVETADFGLRNVFSHFDIGVLLEALDEEEVEEAVRPFLKMAGNEEWCLASDWLAFADDGQLNEVARMLTDPASVLHKRFVKCLFAEFNEWLGDWKQFQRNRKTDDTQNANPQQGKPLDSQKQLQAIVNLIGTPAQQILGQIHRIIQMRLGEALSSRLTEE